MRGEISPKNPSYTILVNAQSHLLLQLFLFDIFSFILHNFLSIYEEMNGENQGFSSKGACRNSKKQR